MSKLPQGWAMSKLGDVCEPSQYGYTAKAVNSGNIHFLRTTDITSGSIDWDTVPFCDVDEETREKYLLRDGDVVISRAGSVGFSFLIRQPEPAVFASYLIRFRPKIYADYFKYFLLTPDYWNAISEQSLGIAVQNVNASKLAELEISIAPAAEQTRIVAKLEELLSDLDAGVAELKAAQRKLAQYRQSLLKAAVEGALSSEGKPYEQVPLGNLVTSIGQGWSPKCENRASDDENVWAVIKTTAIQPLAFDGAHNKVLPKTLKPREHLELQAGDLLVTRAGPRSRVGITCLVKQVRKKLILCDKAYRLRVDETRVLPSFLELALNAPHIVNAIDRLKTGISDSGLNLTQDRFFSLLIPLPSLDEQERLVSLIETSIREIAEQELAIEHGIKQSAAQRKNILKAAFSGQLVPQEPNDEPASVLLERVRAERAARGSEGKRRGRKIKIAS